jgi:hypothetical protein
LHAGEIDLPEIFTEPLAVVVKALTENKTVEQVSESLPDLELWQRMSVSL